MAPQTGSDTGSVATGDSGVRESGPGGLELNRSYEYYRVALADATLPAAFVDLDRLEANARTIRERAGEMPVRVASKSIRSRLLLERILGLGDGFQGLLCYSGREAGYLAENGFDDLVVAYPVWQESDVEPVCTALQRGASVQVMVDTVDHVERLSTLSERYDQTIPLCLDVDLSTDHFGIHFGVRRSGVRDAATARHIADTIENAPGVELAGVMGYEAQLSGVPDDSPARNGVENAAIRLFKRLSRHRVLDRRSTVVDALERAGHDLELVNGGGTGSVEFTVRDPSVTEVTVGSGFLAPALFDDYRTFQHLPAAGFALEVTRTPDPAIYTCRGGGYVASGPPGEDRLPEPWYPAEMCYRDEEAAGEVQTPVRYDGPLDLSLGDPVFFRHAKAGELAEQFERLHLVADGEVVGTVPTYRGDGRCFL